MNVELNESERAELARMVMGLLEEWGIDADGQRALLGLEDAGGAVLSRYRHGKPFPQEHGLIDRARHLIGIQQALHRVFPLNHNMPTFWLHNRNRQLRGQPLQIMLEEGLMGMHRVWSHLDCTINWEQ